MSSPTFGFTGGGFNQPMFGNQTNPTGGSYGTGGGGTAFPSYPLYGSGSTTTPQANAPIFGTTGTGGTAGLSSGYGFLPGGQQYGPQIYNTLGKAYGQGFGQELGNILGQGLFNPQIAAAYLNAMQPGVNRGQANLLQAFGSEGSRFGSAAQLGLGDYLSQVNLNEQQTLASMYLQAQQEQLGLLENVLPTIHGERANKGGIAQDIIGGLEIAGGAIAAPFSGGASLALLGAGLGTLGAGLSGGGSGGGAPTGLGTNPLAGYGLPGIGYGLNTGTFGPNAPSYGGNAGASTDAFVQNWFADEQAQSAASSLGGYAPDSSFSGLPFITPHN